MKILISPDTKTITADEVHARKWNVDKIVTKDSIIKSHRVELPFELSANDITIMVPTVLDGINALNYDGVNLAMRILFKTIYERNRGINIVLMGCETVDSFLCHYPYPNIMKIPGFSYSEFNYKTIANLHLTPCPVTNRNEYLKYIEDLGIHIPSSFKSAHSMTNEWCLYKWNSFMEFDDEEEEKEEEKGNLDYLYFDYIKTIEKINNVKYQKISNNEQLQKRLQELRLREGKILLIDDKPLWHKFFKKFFADSKIEFKAIGSEFIKIKAEEVVPQVSTEVISFEPNVILLDFRLIEDIDSEEKFDHISGTLVLKKLKGTFDNPGVAYGRQVILFTATSRIENIMRLKQLNADDFILKEKPENYNGKEATKDAISKMISSLETAIQRSDFLISLNKKLEELSNIIGDFYKSEIELSVTVNVVAQSIRQITQNNVLNKDILKLVYLNIYKVFEEIKSSSNLVEFPNDFSMIVYAKSRLDICSHSESFIDRKGSDDWNCIQKYNQSSWHYNYCKNKDLNFAICALLIFRLGFSCVDDSDWNNIRIIRNALTHGANDQLQKRNIDLSDSTIKDYSLKMLDLLCTILNPSNIKDVDLKKPNKS